MPNWRKGTTPEEDIAAGEYEEGVITTVDPYDGRPGWSVVTENGWGCGVRDVGVEPKVGDVLTTYGSIGRAFHGQALNGKVLWYLTPSEQDAEFERQRAEDDAKKRAEFEANRAKLDADYATLPETFRERIDRFRTANPDFRWRFESYELFCCTEALKIASWCSVNRVATDFEGDEPTAADNVKAFAKLPFDEQKQAGIADGHSGNTFGLAVRLAYLWVTDPGAVVIEHGALTPLVGCDEYGCAHGEAP